MTQPSWGLELNTTTMNIKISIYKQVYIIVCHVTANYPKPMYCFKPLITFYWSLYCIVLFCFFFVCFFKKLSIIVWIAHVVLGLLSRALCAADHWSSFSSTVVTDAPESAIVVNRKHTRGLFFPLPVCDRCEGFPCYQCRSGGEINTFNVMCGQ